MITRYEINADLSAFKTALEATEIFSSVEFDDDSTPTEIRCKDSSDNLLFKIKYPVSSGGSNYFEYTAYKSDGSTISFTSLANSDSSSGSPSYLYKIGENEAVVHFYNSRSSSACFAIGKTNTGEIGFVFPKANITNNSESTENLAYNVASWDDDGSQDSALQVTSSTPMVGNHSLLAQVPLHGTYEHQIFMKNVFFMPMAQTGLRGVFQKVYGNYQLYLTNGYIAVIDADD